MLKLKGVALLNLGNHEEAIKCFDKALEIDPDSAKIWYNRECSKVKKGDIESSLADLKNTMNLIKSIIVQFQRIDSTINSPVHSQGREPASCQAYRIVPNSYQG
ncbi:MAG: tetratricopeptide repeat protein [Thermoproteota archaeon]|nr:tetratricopeptide repeat protein [Thermoproteota archaeon]